MTKEKIIDFSILALRWYLVYYMIDYGWGKLTMTQFGVDDPAILATPLKDVDSYYVAWHLYGRSAFFNISTGLLEIIGGMLLIFNRTVLIGALLILTILGQILIIDISFTTGVQSYNLPVRISGMILSALLILFYYKNRIINAWKVLTDVSISTKFSYKWWVFIILPVIGFLMDFVFGILTIPVRRFLNWITT